MKESPPQRIISILVEEKLQNSFSRDNGNPPKRRLSYLS
jgi:hypothetical protein